MQRQLPLAALCLLATVPAQGVTSPKGYNTIEGNAAFAHWSATRRFMQVDNTHAGGPFLSRSLAWRRDSATTSGVPRMLDIEVKLGRGNLAVLDAEFDKNFVGAPTIVFPMATVSFPDWSVRPPVPPAAFDAVVAFTVPYVYSGNDALVIDFSYQNVTTTGGLSMDREYTFYASSTGALLGAGCQVQGRSGPFAHLMELQTNGPNFGSYGMRLVVKATNAPGIAGILLFIDGTNSNLTLPGVCTTLHALPSIQLNLGNANANGTIEKRYLSFPFDFALQGANIVTQCVSIDPSQAPNIPFALSDGRQAIMPSAASTLGHVCAYAWAPLPSATATGDFWFMGGGVVMELKP